MTCYPDPAVVKFEFLGAPVENKVNRNTMGIVSLAKGCVRQSIRFTLAALYGAALSTMLSFFPFPKGKIYSMMLGPVVLVLGFLVEKYSRCSVLLPLSLIQWFRRESSFLQWLVVFSGMYIGASYVVGQFRHAIETSPEAEKDHLILFMEKLYLNLDEPIQARLQQSAIVMGFFFAFKNSIIRLILHFFAFVWLTTLPELNPPLAMAWFKDSKSFDGTQLAQFWVNMLFLVFLTFFGTKLSFWGFSKAVQGFKWFKQSNKHKMDTRKPKMA